MQIQNDEHANIAQTIYQIMKLRRELDKIEERSFTVGSYEVKATTIRLNQGDTALNYLNIYFDGESIWEASARGADWTLNGPWQLEVPGLLDNYHTALKFRNELVIAKNQEWQQALADEKAAKKKAMEAALTERFYAAKGA